MSNVFTLPLVKRKIFCVGICLIVSILVAATFPAELVERVPFVRAGMIINGLIMGTLLTMAGFVTWHPLLKFRLHPIFRGAFVAAFVHIDYTIYTWGDQPTFWKTIAIAAVFGAVIDMLATQLFGEGKTLLEGMTK